MKLIDLIQKTGYQTVSAGKDDAEIKEGYTGDLLSDVMANSSSDSVLITIQAHKNTIAVATLAGIKAIVICNGRTVPDDMKQSAEVEGIALLSTKKDQFTVSAEIFNLIKA
ncbi:MAG: DRTGG domain-containing protein [Spirochaetia bacterium]|jgi:predicted transcriptional regulator|nr:DRTGG domain-containing protein [Spirochaetia bacterium]